MNNLSPTLFRKLYSVHLSDVPNHMNIMNIPTLSLSLSTTAECLVQSCRQGNVSTEDESLPRSQIHVNHAEISCFDLLPGDARSGGRVIAQSQSAPVDEEGQAFDAEFHAQDFVECWREAPSSGRCAIQAHPSWWWKPQCFLRHLHRWTARRQDRDGALR